MYKSCRLNVGADVLDLHGSCKATGRFLDMPPIAKSTGSQGRAPRKMSGPLRNSHIIFMLIIAQQD
jgi:hypothetical protein